jgi:hypothetical protein
MEGMMKADGQITGNVGLYYACFRLSRLGWNAMATARNARGIDIVAYRGAGHQFIGVQIKTLSKQPPVPLGPTLDKIAGDYWVIVTNAASDAPTCYIMLPDEVRRGAHRGEKDGKISYWLQPKAYALEAYREKWNRIQLTEPPPSKARRSFAAPPPFAVASPE